jgi:exo-beta-1,3-glucanase (GH17 family)
MSVQLRVIGALAVAILIFAPRPARCQPHTRFAFFEYLTGTPALITYTPSQLDPRQEVNQRRLATSSIRADLEALRPVFDGLVLYGYHEACTPRILAVARSLRFRAVLLGIWDIKSTAEIDGVAEMARQYENDFALAVLVGNEGITFKRYEPEDLTIAAARLRRKPPPRIPLATSEPLVGYKHAFIRDFGDFLAPNIHPVFDRPQFGPKEAAAWARGQAVDLARQSRRPVLLKETGFPHGGKEVYTPASQKAFWSAYLKPGVLARPTESPQAWVSYAVAFDAFDLPWKSEASGLPIESSWGLFSARRQPYPALAPWHALRNAAAGTSGNRRGKAP